jgi:putative NADH-flavin reductase
MKIAIFGASGRTGQLLVEQALEAGFEVTAFVRSLDKLALVHPRLRIVQGDIHDLQAVERVVKDQDAVISALGPSGKQSDVMQSAGINLTDAMEKFGVKRLVVLTGAGVDDPLDRPQISDRLITGLLKFTAPEVYEDSQRGVNLVRGTSLDWTVVRVPRLVDGKRMGQVRTGSVGVGTGRQVTRADVAAFLLSQVADTTYLRKSPVISN